MEAIVLKCLKNPINVEFQLGDNKIKRQQFGRYLEITLESHGSSVNHINRVAKKVEKRLTSLSQKVFNIGCPTVQLRQRSFR